MGGVFLNFAAGPDPAGYHSKEAISDNTGQRRAGKNQAPIELLNCKNKHRTEGPDYVHGEWVSPGDAQLQDMAG